MSAATYSFYRGSGDAAQTMNADWLPDRRTMRYIVDDVRPGLVVDDEQAASAVCLLAKPGMAHLRQRRVTAGNPPNQT
jgi:hypothetical protein